MDCRGCSIDLPIAGALNTQSKTLSKVHKYKKCSPMTKQAEFPKIRDSRKLESHVSV